MNKLRNVDMVKDFDDLGFEVLETRLVVDRHLNLIFVAPNSWFVTDNIELGHPCGDN